MSFPLIFIVGPTAIGKSEFAIKLAQHIDGEIINADSMQVYSELNILTARPSYQDNQHCASSFIWVYKRFTKI